MLPLEELHFAFVLLGSALVLTTCSGGSRMGRSSMDHLVAGLRSPSVIARVRLQSCLAPVVLGA